MNHQKAKTQKTQNLNLLPNQPSPSPSWRSHRPEGDLPKRHDVAFPDKNDAWVRTRCTLLNRPLDKQQICYTLHNIKLPSPPDGRGEFKRGVSNKRSATMQLKLYAVRDIKVGAFQQPLTARTHGEAERSFQTMVNTPNTPFNLYPADFEIFHIGDYDSNTGRLSPLDSPTQICNAVTLVQKLN